MLAQPLTCDTPKYVTQRDSLPARTDLAEGTAQGDAADGAAGQRLRLWVCSRNTVPVYASQCEARLTLNSIHLEHGGVDTAVLTRADPNVHPTALDVTAEVLRLRIVANADTFNDFLPGAVASQDSTSQLRGLGASGGWHGCPRRHAGSNSAQPPGPAGRQDRNTTARTSQRLFLSGYAAVRRHVSGTTPNSEEIRPRTGSSQWPKLRHEMCNQFHSCCFLLSEARGCTALGP